MAIMGLPGTGKTEVARYLGSHLPLAVLSTDTIRLRYGFPSGPATLAAMQEAAASLLRSGAGVVFDGIHLGRQHRDNLRQFASDHDATFVLVYTIAAPEAIRRRLAQRHAQPDEVAAEGKFVIDDHFARFAQYLEPPTAGEAPFVIDTSRADVDAQLKRLQGGLARLLEAPGADLLRRSQWLTPLFVALHNPEE